MTTFVRGQMVRLNAGTVALLTLWLAVSCISCAEDDPLTGRLRARAVHQVEVQSFNSRDDGKILVELAVRSSVGPVLDVLTVTLLQYGADEEILPRDRVPLDLSGMDATGVIHLFTTLTSAGTGVEALSALVEYEPAEADYQDFPELQALLP